MMMCKINKSLLTLAYPDRAFSAFPTLYRGAEQAGSNMRLCFSSLKLRSLEIQVFPNCVLLPK